MADEQRKKLSQRLAYPPYMRFPMRIASGGAVTSSREDHVREQVEQVLFTNPGERVFRPEFGAGIRAFLFEPNASVSWELLRKRLMSSLWEALRGEVDPKTLSVDIAPKPGEPEKLLVEISYSLAALGVTQEHSFEVGTGGASNG